MRHISITIKTRKKKNPCNEHLGFWQTEKKSVYKLVTATWWRRPHLVARPPVGEGGPQLLHAHDLPHVLIGRVTGHEVMIGKLVLLHYTWKYGFMTCYFLWSGNKSQVYILFSKKSWFSTKDKLRLKNNKINLEKNVPTWQSNFKKWIKSLINHIIIGLQAFF